MNTLLIGYAFSLPPSLHTLHTHAARASAIITHECVFCAVLPLCRHSSGCSGFFAARVTHRWHFGRDFQGTEHSAPTSPRCAAGVVRSTTRRRCCTLSATLRRSLEVPVFAVLCDDSSAIRVVPLHQSQLRTQVSMCHPPQHAGGSGGSRWLARLAGGERRGAWPRTPCHPTREQGAAAARAGIWHIPLTFTRLHAAVPCSGHGPAFPMG